MLYWGYVSDGREEIYRVSKMAIEWNDGPVIVLAGPGSGKTAVLTERIKRILLNSQDQSFRVLALTLQIKQLQK